MRVIKILVVAIVLIVLFLGMLQAYLLFVRKPKPMARTEVQPGIFLTVEDVSDHPDSSGLAVTVEVHWNTPGVSFELRPLLEADDGLWNRTRFIPHDWPILTKGYVAILNTSRITPPDWHQNIPLNSVQFVEPLIVRGQLSHFWEHVYMLWWDENLNARLEDEKPMSDQVVELAYWGIGLQAGLVRRGRFMREARDPYLEEPLPISFIGVDPYKRVLYLLAFEDSTEAFAALYAASKGVVEGGRVDSRNGTHLILGRGTGQFMRGIRNLRFLPGYIGVRYDAPE